METTRSRRCKRRCFWCFEGDEMKNDSRNNFSEFSMQPSFSSCNILIFCFCKRLVIQNLLSHLLKPLNYSEMMFFLTVKVLMTGKNFYDKLTVLISQEYFWCEVVWGSQDSVFGWRRCGPLSSSTRLRGPKRCPNERG